MSVDQHTFEKFISTSLKPFSHLNEENGDIHSTMQLAVSNVKICTDVLSKWSCMVKLSVPYGKPSNKQSD